MSIEKKFELAIRNKLRFKGVQGELSVEDVYTLPLTTTVSNKTSIEKLGIEAVKALEESKSTYGFLSPATVDPLLQLRVDILEHIRDVRVAENEEKRSAKEKADTKQKLMAIISEKKDKELYDADGPIRL